MLGWSLGLGALSAQRGVGGERENRPLGLSCWRRHWGSLGAGRGARLIIGDATEAGTGREGQQCREGTEGCGDLHLPSSFTSATSLRPL